MIGSWEEGVSGIIIASFLIFFRHLNTFSFCVWWFLDHQWWPAEFRAMTWWLTFSYSPAVQNYGQSEADPGHPGKWTCPPKPLWSRWPGPASGGLPGCPEERRGGGFKTLGLRLHLQQTHGEQRFPVGRRPWKQGAPGLQILHAWPATTREGSRGNAQAQTQQGLSVSQWEGEHPMFTPEMSEGHEEPGENASEKGEHGAEEETDKHYRYRQKKCDTCTFLRMRMS